MKSGYLARYSRRSTGIVGWVQPIKMLRATTVPVRLLSVWIIDSEIGKILFDLEPSLFF